MKNSPSSDFYDAKLVMLIKHCGSLEWGPNAGNETVNTSTQSPTPKPKAKKAPTFFQ